jgi:hypothetical protein
MEKKQGYEKLYVTKIFFNEAESLHELGLQVHVYTTRNDDDMPFAFGQVISFSSQD